jgi:hypothetical protein
MNNAPIVYMWVAHYNDKQIYPQFDFETGKENTFVSIDQTKLIKFGLYPISKTLENKIGDIKRVTSKVLPYIVLKLNPNQRLIFVRRNYMRRFGYQVCKKCGYKWQWIPDLKEEIGESGLMIHNNHTIQTYENKLYPLAVCPECKTFNAMLCPDCNTLINEYKRPDSEAHYFECPKCKKEHPRFITNFDGVNQEILYLLGYQMTVDNKNFKHIMFINENGEIELTENFEYK